MIDISPIQVVMVLVVALLAFGPRRLPELGRTIGRQVREVRSALNPLEEMANPPSAKSPPPAPPSTTEATPPDEVPDDLAGMIVPGDQPAESDEPAGSARETRE
ncbi:MAG: Sec-independent protein translocase subunit TatA/TatB [Miltoncostaeaceae bacterium]